MQISSLWNHKSSSLHCIIHQFILSIRGQQILNNSKFKVTIPKSFTNIIRHCREILISGNIAQPVEHRDYQLTLSTTFHRGAVPIQTNHIAALVSLSEPSSSRPRFSPSSRSSFAAQVGGEWFSLSMRWLASKKPESSGRWHVSTVTVRHSIVQNCNSTSRTKTLRGTE